MDDGLIGMEVTAIEGNKVICKVLNNGDLGENKALTCRAFPSRCQHWLKKTSKT
ncbi:pyruvate kinase [Enterobacter cancerogenus]|uniref:Pyruvate kinase n=1 Tax=Enterobacter cancerogenus TaxID=69218 RepID=A0A484YRT7_9ENTR|nr:pyruvate kinase [Enterobacter cancerogenus]